MLTQMAAYSDPRVRGIALFVVADTACDGCCSVSTCMDIGQTSSWAGAIPKEGVEEVGTSPLTSAAEPSRGRGCRGTAQRSP